MLGLNHQSRQSRRGGTFIALVSVASVMTFLAVYLIFAKSLTGAPTPPPEPSTVAIERSLKSANAALKAMDYVKSEALARETLMHAPSNASAYNMLGLSLKKQGRPEEAVAAYERAIGFMPSHYEARNNLAVALESMGRTREAEGAYLRALRERPDAPATHLNYALFLEAEGRYEEAITHYYAFTALSQDKELAALASERIRSLK